MSAAKKGLSKMKRTHIHMAQGVPGSGVISGEHQVHVVEASNILIDPLC
jgi:RNA:NAD 2'-phosphotransferase (TPT1/KptA family)